MDLNRVGVSSKKAWKNKVAKVNSLFYKTVTTIWLPL